jgi:hypothetical protein
MQLAKVDRKSYEHQYQWHRGMTIEDIELELDKGGRFVVFNTAINIDHDLRKPQIFIL